ncbi:hypothetical protein SNOG_03515 [Parastagonospora nodorum SN15]|uniref:Heterokaryon incompatibility domain-containing protein n=1 Tax=Phaeosphaeria nodorum (strain SN15 / ATCC MYA-4574 / FGSC 10173) TaxID=321614 RepID=Q0UXJ9_PHANO|nr:hypothetical protein SNOG_03515 [Parastagonospora nodorum SN15]EAT88720.1 hypothetical protein SNOG_03515 [Parastagonospora nodorum SN15]
MSPPRYNYQPLEDKEHIRVLELRPNKLRIEIHIVHVAVSSRCYQALSSAISSIPLTKNLHNALCDLRNTKDMKNRTFWIDQISINQQDDHEKGLQVSMMSQVYSQAQRVVTYLGPEESPDQERKGLQLLERIYKNILDNAWNHIFTAGSVPACLKSIPLDVCVDSNKETPTERQLFELGWIWLVRVAYGEWTQRLWIVQEQILNPEIIILRGHQLIEWDAIATIPILFAIGFIPRVYLRIIKRIMSEDEFSRIDTEECLYSMWWERRARFMDQPPYGQTLVFNIRHYAGLLCGNPLDRVYAILAISSDTHDLALAPDYSRTFEELTKEVSVRTFNLASNLQVLGIASKWRRTGLTLPSWCFMFGGPSDLREIPSTTSFDEYEPHPISSMVRPARFVSEDSVLVVKGRIVDVVCVSQHRLASSSQASLLTQEVTKIGEPDQRLEVTNSADKGGTLVFSSSLCDLLPDDPSSEDLIHLFYIVFARLPWSLPIVDQMSPGETTAFHFLAANVQVLRLEKGRVLGRTRAGRLYNAMQGIEDGDVIMALQGADQLHVMRPCGDMFKLIGDIYVDGLMFGEAYVGQDPNEVDYEISIC